MGDGYIKVSGMSGWYKHIETGVVINTNEQEIQIARTRKRSVAQEKKDKNNMQNEVSSMKTEIEELKALIQTLVEAK
jgi:cbb3-type cytochrome oxidase cytochrome c subunit